MTDDPAKDQNEALAKLRVLREARGNDPTKELRTAMGMLTEARDILIGSKAHLRGASPDSIFSLGALSSQADNVLASLRRDLNQAKATADLFGALESALAKAAKS